MKFRQLSRVGGAALTIAAAVTMLAACGGGSSKATASTTKNAGANGIQAYVSCLNTHGVKIALPSGGTFTRPSGRPSGFPTGPRPSRSPGSGFGGGGGGAFGGGIFGNASNPPAGVSQTTWSAALTACKSVQPTFTRGGAGGFGGGANSQAFQAYLNCLKSHGVSASAGPNSLSTSDPKTAAAMKTCAPLRPSGRPSAAPSPTS